VSGRASTSTASLFGQGATVGSEQVQVVGVVDDQQPGLTIVTEYRTGRWDEALAEAESTVEFIDPQTAALVRGLATLVALHRDEAPTARHGSEPTAKTVRRWEVYIVLARALEQERAHRPEQALAILVDHLTSDARADAATDWVSDLCGAEAGAAGGERGRGGHRA
jgi:hypothetical protein